MSVVLRNMGEAETGADPADGTEGTTGDQRPGGVTDFAADATVRRG